MHLSDKKFFEEILFPKFLFTNEKKLIARLAGNKKISASDEAACLQFRHTGTD